jgi:hypothetical protein
MYEEIEEAEDAPGPARDRPVPSQSVKLPEFWPENSAAWFALAESRFRMKGIFDEWVRYDHVVSALSRDSLRLVLDLVTSPPEDDPYTCIKERLQSSHQLTDYQRIEQLLAMDALGSRRPSELLAHMLELCPAGEEKSKFFAFIYLHRLPQELRIMLGDDDHQEVQQLAMKADRLWAIHGHRQHGAVAAVSATASSVAAVSATAARGAPGNNRRGGRGGQARSRGGPSGTATARTTPSYLAQESAGLCFYHWRFGDKASNCESPCSWQGN